MPIGILTLKIYIAGCHSLKEKRSLLKPALIQLRNEYNVSVAELDHQDVWQSSLIGCAFISADKSHIYRYSQKIEPWFEKNFPHLEIVDNSLEIIE